MDAEDVKIDGGPTVMRFEFALTCGWDAVVVFAEIFILCVWCLFPVAG